MSLTRNSRVMTEEDVMLRGTDKRRREMASLSAALSKQWTMM